MAVRDKIKPLEHHSPGFPPYVLEHLKQMTPASPATLISLASRAYEKMCRMIEDGLNGKGVDIEDEELVAEYVAHLIIDTAILHDALNRAHVFTGEYPYNEYADIILPRPVEDEEPVQ